MSVLLLGVFALRREYAQERSGKGEDWENRFGDREEGGEKPAQPFILDDIDSNTFSKGQKRNFVEFLISIFTRSISQPILATLVFGNSLGEPSASVLLPFVHRLKPAAFPRAMGARAARATPAR